MKYKLVLGCLGVFFIMSVIVACGEGAIDPFSTDDTVAQLSTASLDVGKSINACLADTQFVVKNMNLQRHLHQVHRFHYHHHHLLLYL